MFETISAGHSAQQSIEEIVMQRAGNTLTDPRLYSIRDRKGQINALLPNVFATLTPQSLYWIGFLFADGCLHDREIILCLSAIDGAHIEKFRAFTGTVNSIKFLTPSGYRGTTQACRIAFKSLYMSETLRSYGLLTGDKKIPVPLLTTSRDFWRGMIDGDGWITFAQQKKWNYKKPIIGLCGHVEIISAFLRFVKTICPTLRARPVSDHGKIWRTELASNIAATVIRELYNENAIALERKNLTAQTIIREWIPQSVRVADIRRTNGQFGSPRDKTEVC